MKHKTTLLAAGLASALGATSVAFAADATIYGSIRSGIYHHGSEGGTEASWDLGSVDAGDLGSPDKLWSRIGLRASHDLGNGLTSGMHIEKRLDDWRTRHQNVWLEGAFGRVTLGQQGDAYHSAVSWDGVNFWGEFVSSALEPSRTTGIKYSTKLDGPFNFEAMISDDNSETVEVLRDARVVDTPTGGGDGLDRYELAGSFAVAEVINVSIGYLGRDDGGNDSLGGTVGGSVNTFTWEVGYQTTDSANDSKYYGFHLGYGIGSGNLYMQYEDYNTDNNVGENDALIFGYLHSLGTNTAVIAEHFRPDTGRKRTAIALRINF